MVPAGDHVRILHYECHHWSEAAYGHETLLAPRGGGPSNILAMVWRVVGVSILVKKKGQTEESGWMRSRRCMSARLQGVDFCTPQFQDDATQR